MIRNYFKIAWRTITKYRFFSAVNIIGLFAGILFSLLLAAYIWSELQVNRSLRNSSHQYILTTVSTDPNVGYELASFGAIAKRLKEEYPHLVADFYRYDGVTTVVSKGDKHFREGLQIGDSTLLTMFGFETLDGDPKTALNQPFSVVITEEKARKYFGKTDVVGETIAIQNFSGGSREFLITAVLKKLPRNSISSLTKDFPNSFFLPMSSASYFGRQGIDSWNNLSIASFVELKKGFTAKDLEKPVQQLMSQNVNEQLRKIVSVKPVLLTDYYLNQDSGLIKRMLYTLSFVGLFILLMAIINFINISISKSGSRMKEIGIRKVLGSRPKQLVFQFMVETIILVFLATLLSFLVYPFLRPFFSQVFGTEIPTLSGFPVYFIFIPIALIFVVGIAAGLYPAFVLTGMKSVDSLKGKLKTVKEKTVLRKTLVGVQFSIALLVLIAAGVVTHQISYFFSRNLGYDKEYIVSAQVPRDWSPAGVRKMQTIRDQFALLPEVEKVTLAYEIPNGNNGGSIGVYKLNSDSTKAIAAQVLSPDGNYLQTFDIKLKAGSFLESSAQSDSSKIVVNEKTVRDLGWKTNEEALHQQVRFFGDPVVYTIQGVTTDFHFGSMQQQIPPILFINITRTNSYRFMAFKLKPGNINQAINNIQKEWSALLPGSSFEYTFMDDTLKRLYSSELQLKKATYAATLLALIIVLLGVLGLVSLSIHKRIKEIGIRKVLGASLKNIIGLFAKEFVVVMIIAALVTCPLAWFLMKNWLNNYAYRIEIGTTPFILAISLVTTATLLMVMLQVINAIRNNVIRNLKTE